jgi:hypothetical protein
MRWSAVVFLIAIGLHAQPSGIDGTVMNSVTREPIAGLHVRLQRAGVDPSDAAVYGAISTRTGHFSIAGMPAGVYQLKPESPDYIYVPKGRSPDEPVVLKAGAPLSGFQLEMTPRAVIQGRIVDENGDPMPRFIVELQCPQSATGEAQQSATTNDLGEFRFAGPPGKYLLCAFPPPHGFGQGPEQRMDGSKEAAYGETYFPGTISRAQAAPVEVVPGGELTSLELRVVPQPTMLSISGKVSEITGPSGLATVTLRSTSHGMNWARYENVQVRSNGAYLFDKLEPGSYAVSASQYLPHGHLASPMLEVILDSAPATNIDLVLVSGTVLSGRISLAGEPPGARLPRNLIVRLDDYRWGDQNGEADPEGAFRISDLFPGKYSITLDPLPENAFIQSLKLDDAVVPDRVLDFSRAVPNSYLTITVDLHGAQVSGILLGPDGKPAADPLAYVSLSDGSRLYQDAVGQDGEYVLHGIAPGKYRLVAYAAYGVNASDPAIREKLATKAEEVELKAGEHIIHNLKIVHREDLDADH